MKKNFYTTKLNFISFFYFLILYLIVIKLGNFKKKKKVLDFGAGFGYLKKVNSFLKNSSNIINYDIIPKLTEVKKWEAVEFDTIVFCQSAYMLSKKELLNILKKVKSKNKKIQIINAQSSMSKINLFFAKVLGYKNPYYGLKITPNEEIKTFNVYCKIIKKVCFLNLFKVYLFEFKN